MQNYPTYDRRASLLAAKRVLTIGQIWTHLALPGKAAKSCRCPWREDKHPSFSVSPDGLTWHDFGSGASGDAVSFLQRSAGLGIKSTIERFVEMAGVSASVAPTPARTQPQTKAEPTPERAKPVFPDFRKGTPAELAQLAKLRGIGREGLEFASERGLLAFAVLKGFVSWVVTDSARLNAQARRLDGKPWEHIGAKAWTAKGSWAAWPIGIREAQPFQSIALVEGGPDLLAAHFWVLWEQARSHKTRDDVRSAPVAMLGASHSIPEDALPLFAGKKVRIFQHCDTSKAGEKAAQRWATQLQRVGADVDAFNFEGLVQVNGSPIKDLNDGLFADAKSFLELTEVMP